MRVTFLGTGTSSGVPMIGCECAVCYSTDKKDKRLRTSVLIEFDDGFTIVIDTGPDFRYQMLRAKVRRLDAILFTHNHKDHTAGLDDIRAFNYIQQSAIDVYATEFVQQSLKKVYDYVFAEHTYPGVPKINLFEFKNEPFQLGGKTITPILVQHYKLPVFGFRIDDFTYITDANYIAPEELEKINGSKTFVLNALRLEKHISHFTLYEAIEVAQNVAADSTYFTHISHQLGLHNEIDNALPAAINLAYDGLILNH